MLNFMVIALPRSGTTWAANWLTTDRTFCAHDPLWENHYEDLDREISKRAGERVAGISCTGLWNWAPWLNRHPARKVVLHRELTAVQDSLDAIGLLPTNWINHSSVDALATVEGMHCHYTDLFDARLAKPIWEHLTVSDFDPQRHKMLCEMNVQPQMDRIKPDLTAMQRLASEMLNRTG